MKQQKTIPANVIAGGASVLFFLSIFIQTFGGGEKAMFLLPKAVSLIGIAAGAGIALTGFTGKPDSEQESKGRVNLLIFATGFLLAVFMLLAEKAGFFVMLFVLCFTLYVFIKKLCNETGAAHIVKSLLVSLIITGSLFVIFRLLLKIVTPAGIFV